ncbi:MAG: hypothetical protein HC835_13815 [Oscillatoriales cyanobacterium RM2_1_1]|nr:hypothetical protein [Oscillatoriales cyanobacterium SM2_3_0]NJO46613.1 hypothetical protein [Oscillatoriales cyanobacterium RM2_1_1]
MSSSTPNSTPSADLDQFRNWQSHWLRSTCQPQGYPVEQILYGTDVKLYFDPQDPWVYKQPDWFMVLEASPALGATPRKSYVVWQETQSPFLVVEFLSPETQAEVLGKTMPGLENTPTKWDVYEGILRVPYYIVFDPTANQLHGFQLGGADYENLASTPQGLWIPELELGLGLWHGSDNGLQRAWLRWYDAQGQWIQPRTLQESSQPNPELNSESLPQTPTEQPWSDIDLAESLKKLGLKTTQT